jgi:hypothetical protein
MAILPGNFMPLTANQQNVLFTFHCSLLCWDSLEGYELL